jgi:hypothetical protein
MDAAWLVRARWRRRGAWLWPAFVALTATDAVVGHLLPPVGESQTVVSAALTGLVANLLGVLLLSRPVGAAVRRIRPDLPAVVARDYAGTIVVLAVAVAITVAGLIHHSSVVADRQAMRDAMVRAQAWIGDRAPAEFRRNLDFVDMFAIQQGSIYRACVPSDDRTRSYCVIVNRRLRFDQSVRFSGYEPNSVFGQGVG